MGEPTRIDSTPKQRTLRERLTNCVLLVDDDPSFLSAAALILEANRFNVRTAPDGVEGLIAARRHRPRLVVLDLNMPEPDGYAVCHAIRSDPDLKGAFILILTGDGAEANKRKALALGADLFIEKPLDHKIMIQLVDSVLNGRLESQKDVERFGRIIHYRRESATTPMLRATA